MPYKILGILATIGLVTGCNSGGGVGAGPSSGPSSGHSGGSVISAPVASPVQGDVTSGSGNGTSAAPASLSYSALVQLGQAGKGVSASGVATDPSGNVFISGQTTANLPSCSGVSSNCSGVSTGTSDYYISKYSAAGSWSWTLQMGETGKSIFNSSLFVDTTGNLYIAGTTNANLAACAGVPGACGGASSAGAYDYFITKYNSSGAWQWTQQLGSTGNYIYGATVAVDGSGNVYVGGITTGALDCLSGVSGSCGASTSGYDFFVSKYNSSGTFLWTKELGSIAGSNGQNLSLVTDSSNAVYVAGSTAANLLTCSGVRGTCGGAGSVSTGLKDAVITKYDASGSWVWTKQLGETGKTTSVYASTSTSLATGAVLIAGSTTGLLSACGGASGNCGGSTSQGSADAFVLEYDLAGNYQFAIQLGQTSKSAVVYGLGVNSSGSIFVSGQTSANLVSCNGVSGPCSGSAQGTQDLFLMKFNSSGVWIGTTQFGETATTSAPNYLSLDSLGNVFVAGYTNGNLASCNGVSASCSGTSIGSHDYYIAKYIQ